MRMSDSTSPCRGIVDAGTCPSADAIAAARCSRQTIQRYFYTTTRTALWRSGNGIGHVNKVKLRRARLVLGLVTTFGGSTSPVFSRPTQPGYPSVGRYNVYWRWFLSPLGRKRRVLRISGPCYQDCRHTGLAYASLI